MENEYLKFKQLMNIRLVDFAVCHIDDSKHPAGRIVELDKNVFSKYGKLIWEDVMEAKVEAYNGKFVMLSGVEADRVIKFHNMMTGQDDHKLYERCYLPRQFTMETDLKLAETVYKENAVNLIAVYENMMGTPNEERITGFFSSVGEYYVKNGTKPERVKEIYSKALTALNMSVENFNKSETLNTRQAMRLRMKENLMADKIKVGDTILFVTPEPISAPDEFEITGGVIEEIDEEKKSCRLHSTFTHIDVPFKYILARHNKNALDSYCGWKNAEILLDARASDGQVLLDEAREKYCIEHQSEMGEETTIMMEI